MQEAGLIFVLAGGDARKWYAIRQHNRKGQGSLLLSVARFEIRRFKEFGIIAEADLIAFASKLAPKDRHFFVEVQNAGSVISYHLPAFWLGTLREIAGVASWLRGHPHIGFVTLISSETHLRRVRLCCSFLLPKQLLLRFEGVPPELEDKMSMWRRLTTELTEILKLCLYVGVLVIYRPEMERLNPLEATVSKPP